MKTFKVSRADYEYFKARCLYWVDRFGFLDWEWRIRQKSYDDPSTRSWFTADRPARAVNIYLPTVWNSKPTRAELEITAFHEVLEAGLFYELKEMATDDCSYRRGEVDGVIHGAIHRLEKLILE